MGEIQERLDIGNFYMLDVKVEEMANGLGLSVIGLDRDVATLSGDSVPKYCSRSFFWRSRMYCCWTSLPTIWMLSILIGSLNI